MCENWTYFLVLLVDVETRRDILEISVAVIASAAAVGGVAYRVVWSRPGGIYTDWIWVRHNDVRSRSVLFKIIIETI